MATSTNWVWRAFQVCKVDVASFHWPNVEDIDVGFLTYDIWVRSLQALKHKDSKEKVAANLDYKFLAEFIEFKNMKDMMVGGNGCGYCEESPSNYECEAKSGQPCCILKKVMHCDVD